MEKIGEDAARNNRDRDDFEQESCSEFAAEGIVDKMAPELQSYLVMVAAQLSASTPSLAPFQQWMGPTDTKHTGPHPLTIEPHATSDPL